MTKEFSPRRLDVKAFAQAGGRLSGHESLLKYERLAQEAKGLHPDLQVDWDAQGQWRMVSDGIGQVWLGIKVQARFPMECQRCLGPVDMLLSVEREFRFVADEATAEALDGQSTQDLLALSREFNLHTLMEDELLMALPVVPKHDECPSAMPLAYLDDDFEQANADKPNPFAALAGLRTMGKGGG